MTVPSQRRGPFGVFLYGRSGSEGPGPLQVRWEKAVTAGSPEDLRWFLGEILGIREAEVLEEPWGPRQEMRRVFLFSMPMEAPEASQEAPPTVEADSQDENGDPADPLDGLELEVIALRADGTPLERDRRPSSTTRAMPPDDTMRDLPAPLAGRLEVEGFGLDVMVLALGRRSLRVRTAFVPMPGVSALGLTYRIPTRRGEATIRCECALEDVQDRALRLTVLRVLQESSPGVIDRYLRYIDVHASRNGATGRSGPSENRTRDIG